MKFTKMSGAGNDFVLVEARELPRGRSRPELSRRLCSRRTGVGADGLLILERRSGGRPPKVDYYNADGSRAFCGNGSRCAAWWMRRRGWAGRRLSLLTSGGVLQAVVAADGRVRVRMPEVRGLRLGLKVAAAGKTWTVHRIDTGVPHAVIEVRDLETAPVFEAGRAVRRHRAFAPAGTNVDFIRVRAGRVRIRTYERGVEDETPACGSGAVAAAVCAAKLHGLASPVRLRVRSGDVLKVDFRTEGADIEDVWLEGPAKIVFEGEIDP